MDAINLLKQQHRDIEELFQEIEGAEGEAKSEPFLELADLLSIHDIIEERHFYPTVRDKSTDATIDEFLSAHLTMKSLLAGMLDVDVTDEDFGEHLEALKNETLHHVKLEEEELFPIVRKMLDSEQLELLADRMQETEQELREEGPPRAQIEVDMEQPNVE